MQGGGCRRHLLPVGTHCSPIEREGGKVTAGGSNLEAHL